MHNRQKKFKFIVKKSIIPDSLLDHWSKGGQMGILPSLEFCTFQLSPNFVDWPNSPKGRGRYPWQNRILEFVSRRRIRGAAIRNDENCCIRRIRKNRRQSSCWGRVGTNGDGGGKKTPNGSSTEPDLGSRRAVLPFC